MEDEDFDPDAGGEAQEADPMDEAKPELSRRDVVVFVIDARKPMLEHQLGGLPFAFVALDCVARCMTERIVSAESDLMAVVLVGTAKTGNAYDFAHQSVLMPLAELRASRIRELRNLVAEAKLFGKGDFGADIGGPMEEGEEGRLSVSMALHHVQLLLSKELKANDATKRCIFFTCADHAADPVRAGEHEASMKSRDMLEQGIALIPFFFQPPGPPLELGAFWRKVVAANRKPAQPDGVALAGAADADFNADTPADELTVCASGEAGAVHALVRRSAARRLVRKRVALALPSGQKIGLALVNLVQKKHKPAARTVDLRTNELIVRSVRRLCEKTTAFLNEFQLGHLFFVGGTIATFEPGEKAKLADFGDAGLRCIGFVPAAELQPYHMVGAAAFATASNEVASGSAGACRALITQMAAKRVAMVASWVSKGGQPRLLALSPQLERRAPRAAGGIVELPFGFHVARLPYSDDLRDVPLAVSRAAPSAEAVDAAREVVRALGVEYEPKPSPVLAHFYTALEAAALNEAPQAVVDATLPDEERALKRAREQVERLRGAAYGDEYDPDAGAKKKRPPKAAVPETDDEWRALASSAGALDALNADALKGYCEQHGLKKSGKKSDLVARVAAHVADG